MSGEQGELDVSKAALGQIAKGITDTLSELKELGSIGTASMGGGFTELKLSGMQTGHETVTSMLDAFCERWGWGVRSLVQEANEFAAGVGLSAGLVHEQDQYLQGGFKVMANAVLGGNPHASEQEVTGKDWGEVLASNPYTNFRDADFSAESALKSKDVTDRAWAQTWEDIAPRRDVDPSRLAELSRDRDGGEQR
ncbi:hypothetical protein [Streptomyces lavendulae]|uniref:hypothetical protein n=1 Tax=Streptomyces lavendulae TaxID=1914 RepID=UPI0024A128CB|nr:hypothetical protein [Streptomyces lavendulae]GLX18866.1 hypothetical protein Slala01_25100 [Streptomyces lavendulae subsp. lavendulae]GLX29212.1 hypothetical protein Slala02_50320 [Streptomyces lavendulae subsp. lavendulae]